MTHHTSKHKHVKDRTDVLCALNAALHILRTVYTLAARWGRHTASGHVEVSRVIFFIPEDFISFFFNWKEQKAHRSLRLATALRERESTGWFFFREEGEIWVCASVIKGVKRTVRQSAVSHPAQHHSPLNSSCHLVSSAVWHWSGKRTEITQNRLSWWTQVLCEKWVKFVTSRILIHVRFSVAFAFHGAAVRCREFNRKVMARAKRWRVNLFPDRINVYVGSICCVCYILHDVLSVYPTILSCQSILY